MRRYWVWLVVLVCAGVACGEAARTADPMAPVSWMAGKWVGEVKAPGDAKATVIASTFEPVLGGKMLKIQTSFDGKGTYEGMFGYDPEKKAIAFWYLTAEGESVTGTVIPQAEYLLFDFEIAKPGEKSQHLQTHIHQDDANHYTWALFADTKGTGWVKLFDVHYHRVG